MGKTKVLLTAVIVMILYLLFDAPLALADTYEIYTYGSGDFVAQVFTGVALLFSGSYIESLIKVVLLVGLLTALLNPISAWLSKGAPIVPTGGEGFLAILRQTLLAIVAVYIFIIPKTNIAIVDRLDPAQSQIVSDVPFVQGIIAHAASTIGDVIGREMETAFSLPDAMKFRNGGVGLGIKHLNTIYDVMPPSASTFSDTGVSSRALIKASLTDYFNQCVFKNFATLDGAAGLKTTALYDLLNSKDVMATLIANDILYGDPNTTVIAPTDAGFAKCSEVLPLIRGAWLESKTVWLKEIEKNTATGTTQEVLNHYFPDGGDTFIMMQSIAIGNVMRIAARNYSAAMDGNSNELATELAMRGTLGGWQTTARMFEKIVQVMRNVFEGLIYGLSVLLPVAVAVAGLSPLGTYFKIVLWLQLWCPFYILLNLFGDMEIARSLNVLAQQSGGGFVSLAQWRTVGEKAQISLGYLGSLAFTIPMFAWGLLKGGEYAMSSAIGAMSGGGGAATQASAMGSQIIGSGNVSVATRSVDNMRHRISTEGGSQVRYALDAGSISSNLDKFGPNGMTAFSEKDTSVGLGHKTGMLSVMSPASAHEISRVKSIEEITGAKTTQEIADKHTNGSVEDLTRANTIASKGYNVSVMDAANKTAEELLAAKAKPDAATAKANAELSQNGHDSIAKTALDVKFGETSGRLKVDTDAGRLSEKLSRFSLLDQNANVDATEMVAKTQGKTTGELLFAGHSVKSFAGDRGERRVAVNAQGEIVRDSEVSGKDKTINHDTIMKNFGSNFAFGNKQLAASLMNGDVKGFNEALGGSDRMWNDKNTGMAAVTDTSIAISQYMQQSKGLQDGRSLNIGAKLSADVSLGTPGVINAISPITAKSTASAYGGYDRKVTGSDNISRNEIFATMKNEYTSLANDKSLTNAERSERYMLKAQELMSGADAQANKGTFKRIL